MKYLALIFLLFTVNASAESIHSEDATIWGYVQKEGTEIGVEGVHIALTLKRCGLDDYILTAWTGVDGRYYIGGLDAGVYIVKPMADGKEFKPEEIVVKIEKE